MFKRMQSMQMQAVHCFQTIGPDEHEYRAIIALHNTHLGPALGGCRCLSYDHENFALDDAMRLAQGMSYKAALANLPQGGGKAVIILPKNINPNNINRRFLFTWFGQCVDQLNGRYITAMDVGTQVTDMDVVALQTSHVASASNIGDPADSTAEGVVEGIKAALDFYYAIDDSSDIAGKTFAVQGLGHVGWRVAKMLKKLGGHVIAADPDEEKCQQAKAQGLIIVGINEILTQPCDVLVPCALGGVINNSNVKELRCKIIAGSANNQLSDNEVAEALDQRQILYAPDYVINAGGLIFASMQYRAQCTFDDERLLDRNSEKINKKIKQKINEIYATLMAIFQQAKISKKNVNDVANEIAQQKLNSSAPCNEKQKPSKEGGVYDAA